MLSEFGVNLELRALESPTAGVDEFHVTISGNIAEREDMVTYLAFEQGKLVLKLNDTMFDSETVGPLRSQVDEVFRCLVALRMKNSELV